jgi:hypothetical protein
LKYLAAFEENKHAELLLCDGTCEFNFTNTTIARNMGIILATGLNAVISFNESWIIDNDAGNNSLFQIPGSEFYVFHPCVFARNTADSIVDLRGGKSIVKMKHAKFRHNQVSFVMGMDTQALCEMEICGIGENLAAMGSIVLEDSVLRARRCTFFREGNTAIRLTRGRAVIDNSGFKDNLGVSVSAVNATVTMNHDHFTGGIRGGHLALSGRYTLNRLRFTAKGRLALSDRLRKDCATCMFGDEAPPGSSTKGIVFLACSVVFVAGAVVMLLRPRHSKRELL